MFLKKPDLAPTDWASLLPEMYNLSFRLSFVDFLVFYSGMVIQGVSKKLSFAKLSIWRSCCQLRRNKYDIRGKSANAQFGKTQFFRHPVDLCSVAAANVGINSLPKQVGWGHGETCLGLLKCLISASDWIS